MTRNDIISKPVPLNDTIERAIATYGALPVLIRTLRAIFRSNRPPPLTEASDLSPHLRRDVGLNPLPERPVIF